MVADAVLANPSVGQKGGKEPGRKSKKLIDKKAPSEKTEKGIASLAQEKVIPMCLTVSEEKKRETRHHDSLEEENAPRRDAEVLKKRDLKEQHNE